jgi:hypothetical protein
MKRPQGGEGGTNDLGLLDLEDRSEQHSQTLSNLFDCSWPFYKE